MSGLDMWQVKTSRKWKGSLFGDIGWICVWSKKIKKSLLIPSGNHMCRSDMTPSNSVYNTRRLQVDRNWRHKKVAMFLWKIGLPNFVFSCFYNWKNCNQVLNSHPKIKKRGKKEYGITCDQVVLSVAKFFLLFRMI